MRELTSISLQVTYRRLRQRRLAALVLLGLSLPVWGAGCKVLPAHAPSDAEIAFQKGDYAKAATLLEAEFVKTPNDPDKTALLVRALLWQRKMTEAADTLNKALAAQPGSATLLTEQAELTYRQGKPWAVGSLIGAALKADPCFSRAYILYSWLMGAQSNHLTQRKAIQTAHQLDPNDPEIRRDWMNTLSLKEHIAALDAWITSGTITDADELKRMQKSLDTLKKLESEPPKPCRLTSASASVDLPLQDLIQQRRGTLATSAYALQVDLNGHQSLLQMDTGASGLSVTKAVADHAGLKSSGAETIRGVGDEGPQHGYRAYADRIQIGSLEFKDCVVSVLEKGMGDNDGLIGADVFSHFLVTIDYPTHKIRLEPLPAIPNQAVAEEASLSTASADAPEPQRGAADAGNAAPGTAAPAAPPGLTDRYIAPEMKDWVQIYRIGHFLITPGSLHLPDVKLFIVDTGAWSTTVAPEAAREVTKVDLNTNMRISGLSGEVAKPYVAEVLDIKFGGISKHELGVPAFSMDMQNASTGMDIAGMLGADILDELTIHIDYRDGLMKFEYDPKRGYHPQNR